jgi:hypothetical protein
MTEPEAKIMAEVAEGNLSAFRTIVDRCQRLEVIKTIALSATSFRLAVSPDGRTVA